MGLRGRWQKHELAKDGLPAEAVVLERSEIGAHSGGASTSLFTPGPRSLSRFHDVRLIVEVRPPDGDPFRAELTHEYKEGSLALPLTGGTVAVRYDPDDHTVVLDGDAVEKRAQELAAGIEQAQDDRAASLLAGEDPPAARMTEAEAMLKQVQTAGLMSPQMQAMAQQAEAFMHGYTPPAAAGGPGVHFPTPATATVLSYETVGASGNFTVVRVRVSCQSPSGEPMETTLDTAVSPSRLIELAPGAKLPVLFDPNDPSKVYPASSLL